jgi:DNA repair protein RecN (Recombination protein N)
MLSRLTVRDLAVIRAAELEFGAGFTVLTGETGAGKSLLVDAMGLALGDRGAAALVRDGAQRANVTAEFSLPDNDALQAALGARALPEDDPLTLHRQTSTDGRSRAWVNGVPMPLAALREVGETLIEIHGQHENLALARPAYQCDLLDGFAGTQALAADIAGAAKAVRSARAALDEARATVAGREARLEFLRFQVRELAELAPRDNEYAELNDEFEALHHRERSAEALANAFAALDEGEAPALAALAGAREALARLPAGAGFADIAKLIGEAESLAEEAVRELHRLAGAEPDPSRLEWLNERIARYQSLARKHDCKSEELAKKRQAMATEIAELESGDARSAQLERALAKARDDYEEAATTLSAKRSKAAPKFAAAVTQAVRELGMPRARFEVVLEPTNKDACPPGGCERIGFLIAASSGQTPGSIAQVASGGELSRLALAIEVVASADSAVSVMVFDEVDAGVSGRVAELVGRRLKALAAQRQVLCVTHLPQVAALADHHYYVGKRVKGKTTATQIDALDDERRVEAIAAMLAGVKVGESARRHARELIAQQARV